MELELLDKILPHLRQNDTVSVGPGDDCAVVRCGNCNLLLAVDQVTENIHFTSATSPERAAEKLVKRNLSDIAAMGGTPLWMLLSILSNGRECEWLERFAKAAAECAGKYNTPITGGDISSLPHEGFSASITVIGKAEKPILRSGAKNGDSIFVTGVIGNSFLTEHHLDFHPQLEEGKFLAGYANAMMDISDGLLLDAVRMAEISNVDFLIAPEKIPLRNGAVMPGAMSDGEDYGLLFTAPEKSGVEEAFNKKFPDVCITKIGKVISGNGNILNMKNRKPFELKRIGYEH